MSSPRDPDRDLSLERLGDRDGQRPRHYSEAAHVGAPVPAASKKDTQAAYQALIDAVFTAKGVGEWLHGLRRKVAALVADKESASRSTVSSDAIRLSDPDIKKG